MSNDDARIDVQVDGNGDDAIVLLHGFPLTRDIWNETTPALAQRRRVVRPDLRGMGTSAVTDGPYLMEALAGDIAAVLDALAISRAAIVGHSLGGYVALAFARMYSERVNALALVCSRLAADTPERARWRYELADRAQQQHCVEPIVDAMLAGLFSPETRENKPNLVRHVREIALRNSPDGLAEMLRGMAVRDAADDIAPDLEMPVLVVAGRHDAASSIEEAQTAAGTFPNGRLVVFEHSGHLPMLEEPEAFTSVLASFP